MEKLEDRQLMAVGEAPLGEWLGYDRAATTLIARFTPETSPEQVQQIASDAGLVVTQTYSENMFQLAITADGAALPAANAITQVANLWHNDHIVWTQPDFIQTMQRVPNDPLFQQQWGLQNTGQNILPLFNGNPLFADPGTNGVDSGATTAWNAGVGDKRAVVAVFDTGIDRNHPDLRANMWRNPNEIAGDGIDNDANGYIDDIFGWNAFGNNNDIFDRDGHGTHVSGIIGAVGDNGIGVAGMNWNVELMGVKVLDPVGSSGSLMAGLQYIVNAKAKGANIVAVNASLGGGPWDFGVRDALSLVIKSDILFVAAAGNSAVNNDVFPFYPTNYDFPEILSVAALDNDDNLANFSQWGKRTVDIGAPGVNILSTVSSAYPAGPDVIFQGTGANRAKYAYYSGTSMAAPMVTGAVALLKSLRPELTMRQLRDTILNTADVIPSLTDMVFTDGKLNVARAVDSLPHATISGTVFEDSNGDGAQNGSEVGIAGAVVYVDGNNNNQLDSGEASTTSALDGTYSLQVFSGAGTKTIRQVPLSNYVQTAGAGGYVRNLQIPSTINGLNFGNRGVPSQITGRIIVDANRNGLLDQGEGGASQIVVYADYNNDGKLGIGETSTKSDANGNYTLIVSPGTYTIRLSKTPGWEASIVNPADPTSLGTRTGVVVVSTQITAGVNFFVTSVVDWGDSPDSYNYRPGTTIYEPPSHGILPNLYIGAQNSLVAGVDGEAGPLISATASADSLTGIDDEPASDIVLLDELKAGTSPRIQIKTTTGNNPQALLQGWIDFDRNGIFDANEQIVTNVRVGNGVVQRQFNVPSTFTVGTTFARFRLGYEQNLGPTGAALAGEVVDFELRVFGVAPLANDDPDALGNRWRVNQNSNETDAPVPGFSDGNTIPILANDVQSLTSLPRIAKSGSTFLVGSSPSTLGNLQSAQGGTLFIYDNGTPGDPTDDKIRYRPPANMFGPDEFYYQVTDAEGHLGNIAKVSITILPADPIARDDTFTVNNVPTIIDVLANDLARGAAATGGTRIEIVGTPTLPANTGTVTVLSATDPNNPTRNTPNAHEVLSYNPGSFTGSFEFTYVMNDTQQPVPVPPAAKVTMQVVPGGALGPVPDTAKVRVRAEVSNSTRAPGQTVDVNIYVQDIRDDNPLIAGRQPPPNAGVISIGVDLLYNPSFVLPNLKTDGSVNIVYGPGFLLTDPDSGNLTDPFIIAPGLIDEISAVYLSSNLTGQEQLFATITFDVLNNSGTTSFTVNPADEVDHEVYVYDANTNPIQVPTSEVFYTGVAYNVDIPTGPFVDRSLLTVTGGGSLVATGEGEYTNPVAAQDVNNDHKIDIQDAVSVIKTTRTLGAQPLQTVGFQASVAGKMPTSFVDVNRDGLMNVQDALAVIRYLRGPKPIFSNLEGASSRAWSGWSDGGAGESASGESNLTATDYLFATESFGTKKTYSSDAILNDDAAEG